MRRVIAVALVAGSVALAVVIGQRMSTDAMAVVIGVVFGVAASIPTSLLVIAATRGRREEPPLPGPDPRPAVTAPPQIFVVSPPTSQQGQVAAPWLQSGTPSILPPTGYGQIESSRRFKVVGEDEYWMTDE